MNAKVKYRKIKGCTYAYKIQKAGNQTEYPCYKNYSKPETKLIKSIIMYQEMLK